MEGFDEMESLFEISLQNSFAPSSGLATFLLYLHTKEIHPKKKIYLEHALTVMTKALHNEDVNISSKNYFKQMIAKALLEKARLTYKEQEKHATYIAYSLVQQAKRFAPEQRDPYLELTLIQALNNKKAFWKQIDNVTDKSLQHYLLGKQFLEEGDPSKAADHFSEATKLLSSEKWQEESTFLLFYHHAKALWQLGDLEGALKTISLAINSPVSHPLKQVAKQERYAYLLEIGRPDLANLQN